MNFRISNTKLFNAKNDAKRLCYILVSFFFLLSTPINLYSQQFGTVPFSPNNLFRHKSFEVIGKLRSPIKTGIYIDKEEFVYFEVQGKIKVGSFLGKVYGDGKFLDPSFGNYNKYNNCNHGALICKVEGTSYEYCSRTMFQSIWDGIDESIYNQLVDKSKMVTDGLNYVPGNYFISKKRGQLILDINDTKVEDNEGKFIVNIYTLKLQDHKNRNVFNQCPYPEPQKCKNSFCEDCNGDKWLEEKIYYSWKYHGYNDAFRGKGKYSGCQCVYDSDTLLTNHEYEGTFDIGYWLENGNSASPSASHLHLILDVIPHDYFINKFGKNKAKYVVTGNIYCRTSSLFLFDLSGSMNENGANTNKSKLQQAKDASRITLNSLKNNNSGVADEVGVFGFSGGCSSDPTWVISNFETELSLVESRIDAMNAGGGTPLAEAIAASKCKLANHLAQTGQDKGKLIILSDGQATCNPIRPNGVYNSGQLGQQIDTVSANQCRVSGYQKPNIKYYTIGFNIVAGSPAERDLQYLAQISGGKYLNVQSQTQLERAFRKFNRTYIPKANPALSNLPSSSTTQFRKGVSQINSESFTSALDTYEAFAMLHDDDCHGAFNLALMQEANDFYKKSISNYQKYLKLCPNATDKDFVERQIIFLEEEFKQFKLFQKKVVMSDLEYLKLHFEKIQNGQSIVLAEEFKGFLKEKGNYYVNLPELMGRTDRLFKKNTKEVASGLTNCAKTINRNPETWDRDATPILSMTYLNLERLIEIF